MSPGELHARGSSPAVRGAARLLKAPFRGHSGKFLNSSGKCPMRLGDTEAGIEEGEGLLSCAVVSLYVASVPSPVRAGVLLPGPPTLPGIDSEISWVDPKLQ